MSCSVRVSTNEVPHPGSGPRDRQWPPGDGKKLPLSLGEAGAVVADDRNIAVFEVPDKGIRIGQFRRFDDFLIRSIQPSEADVVGNGPFKQMDILKHHAHDTAQVQFVDPPDVDAVDGDGAVFDLVEPVDEIGDGSLAGAGV